MLPPGPSPFRIGVPVLAGIGEAALGSGGVGWGAIAVAIGVGVVVEGGTPCEVVVGAWVGGIFVGSKKSLA